jgi:hypothetical protein
VIHDCSVGGAVHAQANGLSVKAQGQDLRNMTRFSAYWGLSVPVANPPTLVGGCSVDERAFQLRSLLLSLPSSHLYLPNPSFC